MDSVALKIESKDPQLSKEVREFLKVILESTMSTVTESLPDSMHAEYPSQLDTSIKCTILPLLRLLYNPGKLGVYF